MKRIHDLLPGWITRNLRMKALATALALASWVVVVYAANPPDSRQIVVHVQQSAQELPGKFVLAAPIADISMLVSGTRDNVDAFNTSSIHAAPNFNEIKATGLQQLPLTVVNTDPYVDLSDVPSTVTADIDVNGATSVPVIVNTTPTQVGYEITSKTTNPAQVELIGPNRELQVAQAVVNVDLGTRIISLIQDAVVQVVNPHNGNRQLTDVTVSEPTVQVTVEIKPAGGTVESTVIPELIGSVAPGHELSGVSADPPLVTLQGPEPLLNGLQQFPTPQISIAGLSSDQTFPITLQAPSGVQFQSATGQLTRSIQVNIHVSITTLPEAVVTPTAPTPFPSATPRPTAPSTPAVSCRQAPLGTPCPSPGT